MSYTIHIPEVSTFQFEEAEIYENRIGQYMVIKIQETKMLVEYITGERVGKTQELETKGQKKAHVHLLQEKQEQAEKEKWEKYLDSDISPKEKKQIIQRLSAKLGGYIDFDPSDETYFTLGYLANNSKLWAEIGVIYLQAFNIEYYQMTGISADPYIPKNKPNQLELRISFSTPSQQTGSKMKFPCDVNICNYGEKTIINNCSYFWKLIDYGFRIGNYQMPDRIIEQLPENKRNGFMVGMAA